MKTIFKACTPRNEVLKGELTEVVPLLVNKLMNLKLIK